MTADSDAPVAVAGAGTRSAGYLSATLGTLIGANAAGFGLGLGIAVPAGQLLGDLGRPGGLEVLIGALLGFVLGWRWGARSGAWWRSEWRDTRGGGARRCARPVS